MCYCIHRWLKHIYTHMRLSKMLEIHNGLPILTRLQSCRLYPQQMNKSDSNSNISILTNIVFDEVRHFQSIKQHKLTIT